MGASYFMMMTRDTPNLSPNLNKIFVHMKPSILSSIVLADGLVSIYLAK